MPLLMKTGITSLIIYDRFICFRGNTLLKPNTAINIQHLEMHAL